MVEPDFAELVDHHGRAFEGRIAEERADQRRLAAAEKAGQDRNRDRRLAQQREAAWVGECRLHVSTQVASQKVSGAVVMVR